MRAYYAVVDGGDGSARVRWYRPEHVEHLDRHIERDPDYGLNEGFCYWIELPDDFDLDTLDVRFYDPSDED